MLEYNTILNLMTKHFPRWMDIRKRVKTSSGGKYLQSISHAVTDIQDAINDYKKDFFLVNYRDSDGEYEDIPYYVYYIDIGDTPKQSIAIITPVGLHEVPTAEEFHNTENSYYHEDTRLFFSRDSINEKDAKIEYTYNSEKYSAIAKKMYVWNVYDEFAAFAGLIRFENENNTELVNRILNVFECRANTTEDGIKNAIINSTINFINESYPNLNYDEIRQKIIVERPSPENLVEKYNEFTSIIDKLADINRDVYRTKTWDIDLWQFNLSGIDYIPHEWDRLLLAYSNGVGFKDDLKPELVSDIDDSAVANIQIAYKTEEAVIEYIKNNVIEKNISLGLTKYDKGYSPVEVSYSISAEKPVNITNYLDSSFLVMTDKYGDEISKVNFSSLLEKNDFSDIYSSSITESFFKLYSAKSSPLALDYSSYEALIKSKGKLPSFTSNGVTDNSYYDFITLNDGTTCLTMTPSEFQSFSNYHLYIKFNNDTIMSDYKYIKIKYMTTDTEPGTITLKNNATSKFISIVDDTSVSGGKWIISETVDISDDGVGILNRFLNNSHNTLEYNTNLDKANMYIKSIMFFDSIESAEAYGSPEENYIHMDNNIIQSSTTGCDINDIIFSVESNNLNLSPVFVYDDNGVIKYDISNSHMGAFDKVYFQHPNNVTYIARNSHKLFYQNNDNYSYVDIINSFVPFVSPSELLVYCISQDSVSNSEFVKFYTDNYGFSDYSFGRSMIAIKPIFNNSTSSYSSHEINIPVKIQSPSIDINNIFSAENLSYIYPPLDEDDISNFNILDYHVTNNTPNSSLEYDNVLYEDMNNPVNNNYFKCTVVSNFNPDNNVIKLDHENIYQLLYVGTDSDWSMDKPLSTNGVSINKELGVVTLDSTFQEASKLYIYYFVSITSRIVIGIDELYNLVEHNKNAYKINTINNINIYNGFVYDYASVVPNNIDKDDCNIYVSINNSNFSYSIVNNTIVFNKTADNALSVKCGYYYIDGDEYYLLPEDSTSQNINSSNIKFDNAYIDNYTSNDSHIVLSKQKDNYIKNSKMNLSETGYTYYLDAINYMKDVPFNLLGSSSSCDNFFNWKTFGATLSLVNYDSDKIGMEITPFIDNGHAYIDITTNDSSSEYFISFFYGGNNIEAKIAREVSYDDMQFNKSMNTEFLNNEFIIDSANHTMCTTLVQENNYKYYLVIFCPTVSDGKSYFDNVILTKISNKDMLSSSSNIEILGLNINEYPSEDCPIRLHIDDKFSSHSNTEIDNDGYIINTSSVEWNMTKFAEYSTSSDFESFVLRNKVNINDTYNYLYTLNEDGVIETAAIFIDNPNVIKNIIMEINDIPFNNMAYFSSELLTSNTSDGDFEKIAYCYDNYGGFNTIDGLKKYIKLRITMPQNSIISNISAYFEYYQTEDDAPVYHIAPGDITSSIIDSHYIDNYYVSDIGIKLDNCNTSDFTVSIRAYQSDSVWTDWKNIVFDDTLKIISAPTFTNTRFFQVKVSLHDINARVKIDYIDIQKEASV